MEARKRSYITAIERVLNSEQLLERQRKTLVRFDRFNACMHHRFFYRKLDVAKVN